MRVLYAAMYPEPRDPNASSGVDYNFCTAISRHFKEVRIAGPFRMEGFLPERIVKRAYTRLTGKRYMKWNLRAIWNASQGVNRLERQWQPDIVFTIFPAPLTFYKGQAPAIFTTDLTFKAWQAHGAGFGRLALEVQHWIEKRAVSRSARVIVHSEWGKQEIIKRHQARLQKIEILPMPAALPLEAVPNRIDVCHEKRLQEPLRLLLVGREFKRKGVDIAMEVVAKLNQEGLPAVLKVCATSGPAAPYVSYEGPYLKTDPRQLKQYTALYRWAHLLLHPARFEPAGIVPGEAAAFGTPTITNDVGGLATTVRDGISGVVLPRHSSADAYVQAIRSLYYNPDHYYALCRSTRQRYEKELNWLAAGNRVAEILQGAATQNGQT